MKQNILSAIAVLMASVACSTEVPVTLITQEAPPVLRPSDPCLPEGTGGSGGSVLPEGGSGGAAGAGGTASQGYEPACEASQQSMADCDACTANQEALAQAILDLDNEDLDAFDNCYEGSPGSFVGDPGDCDELYPEGAHRYRTIVYLLCRDCSADCCYFCSSPWGMLLP